MCEKLEEVGLRAPEYYCNSYMLQAIIHNSNIEKLAIDDVKLDIRNQKLEIENKNSDIQNEKLSLDK